MRLITTCAAAAALALLASAGAASAQETTLSYNVALTSDYVFRGFSQTNEKAALSGGIDATVGGFYVGGWASNVDFGDSTDAEIDLYGGYRTEVAGFGLDVGLVGYTYINTPNMTEYPYIEYKAAISRAFGPLTAGAALYYSNDFFGVDEEATYIEANAAYTPIEHLTISGAYGKQALDVSDDYNTWNVGASYALPNSPLTLDVRYYDTDIDDVAIADGRVVGTLKAAF